MRNPEFEFLQFFLFWRNRRLFPVWQDQGFHRRGGQAAAFQPAEFSKEGSPLFPRSKESKILCTAIPAQDPEPTQGVRAVSRFLRRGGYQPPVPILSIAILLVRPAFPAPVLNCLDYLGSMVTFMTVAIIGHSLANIPLGHVFRDVRVYLFVLLRFVAVPIVLGALLKRFVSDGLLVYVTALLMAMPVGSLPMMLAQERGRDAELLTKGVVVSTMLSVVTIVVVTSVVGWI